jgi:hypothetical protein
MRCIKIQSMITPFINDKLNIKELEEFLDHVHSCPNCREELEFYYALLTAMKQLDEDKDPSDDFDQELSEKLEKAQERVIHAKYTYYRKKAVLILTMILLAFLIGLGYSDNNQDNGVNITESDFRIRRLFREPGRGIIEIQLQTYLKEQEAGQLPTGEQP